MNRLILQKVLSFFIFLNIIGGIVLAQAQPEGGSRADASNYVLSSEDIIAIDVAKHPEFSGVFPISLEGKIQYKFLGDIEVAGMTKSQLEDKIREAVSKYAVSPEVTVTITEFKSQGFYVLGEVKSPGKYNMRSKTISVNEAVMMAGLPTQAAAMRKAMIISSDEQGNAIKEVDLQALLYEGLSSENMVLNPGDTLYVPSTIKELSNKKEELPSEASQYALGPDDIVDIAVANHSEFSGRFPVSPEGKIQYKFAGDIKVTGMTKTELEEKIRSVLSGSVVAPQVNVIIAEFKSKIFYVLGEVAKPGKYYMRSESLTVKDAVLMASLPTKAAALRKAKINSPGGTVKDVDLYAALYEADPKQNTNLYPGDTLYVPSSVTESTGKTKQANNFAPLTYTLGPDDVLDISVMQHPEFSGIYPISLEGKIQYKFVGDIRVTGMTKGELEEKIKSILSNYVASPEVNVAITDFKSKAFYVLGEVGAPGKFFMRADHITVSEAVVMAGLPTLAAAMRKTQIITPGINGSTVVRKVNLYDLLYKGDLKDNLVLNPGDYLYVPSTILAKFIRVINPVSETVGMAASPAANAATFAK